MTDTDFSILFAIRELFAGGTFDSLMLWASTAGDAGAVWFAIGAVLLWKPSTRRLGAAVILAVAVYALIGNGILKPLIERLRPCELKDTVDMILACPETFSFPSGHTGASFAAAGVFWLLKSPWRWAALAGAALIAFSRLYLFVHFPSDIAGGIFCGLFAAFVAVRLTALPALSRRLA